MYMVIQEHKGISYEYQQHIFSWRNKKYIYPDITLIKNCQGGGGVSSLDLGS